MGLIPKHNGISGSQDGDVIVNGSRIVLRMDVDGADSVHDAATVGEAGSNADTPFGD